MLSLKPSKSQSSRIHELNTASQNNISVKSEEYPRKLLESLQDLLPQVEVVSFDVFDTVLQRIVYPKEIFAILELEAIKRLGYQFRGLANRRIQAEICARKRKKKEAKHCEVQLEEIYKELCGKDSLWLSFTSDLIEFELEQEKRFCRAHPTGFKLWQLARSKGKRTCFISDMYLGAGRIKSLLSAQGYNDPKVFCSSDQACSKSSGRLYHIAAKALGTDPSKILHIGDNKFSDQRQALNSGFKILSMPEPSKPPKQARHFPKIIERDNIARVAAGIIRHESPIFVSSDTSQTSQNNLSNVPRKMGHSAIGPLAYGLCHWLKQQIIRDEHDLVLFLGRDGYLPHKILSDWQSRYGFLANTRLIYFPFSRRAAALACASNGITPLVIQTLGHHRRSVPVQDYFERIGLKANDHLDIIYEAGLDSPMRIVHRYKDRKRMEHLIKQLENHLKRLGKIENEALLLALKKVGFFSALSPAIYDIGWRGTQQACLQSILHSGSKLHGYYLSISDPLPAVGTTKGYLVEEGTPTSMRGLLESATPIVELSFSSAEPNLLYYKKSGNESFAVYDKKNPNARAINEIHSGAISFVDSMVRFQGKSTVSLSPEDAVSGFAKIALNPTDNELSFLQTLIFSDALGREKGRSLRTIEPPSLRSYIFNYHKFFEAYSETFWRANFIQKMSLIAKFWVWTRSPSFRRIWNIMRIYSCRHKKCTL